MNRIINLRHGRGTEQGAVGLRLFFTAFLFWGIAGRLYGAGSTSMNFLRLDVGPRQVGMGGVGVAVSNDVYSMVSNPASLGQLSAQQVAFSHVNWIQEFNYQDILYAMPTQYGTFGGRLENLSYGNIDSYDAGGFRTGSINAGDFLLALSYAKPFPSQRMSAGASVKFAQEKIGDATARANMLDLGVTARPFESGRFEALSLGLAVKHLGQSVKFDQTRQALPRSVDFGIAMPFMDEALVTGLDFHFTNERPLYANLGAEYWFQQQIAIRGGFETGQEQGPGLRVGVGFRITNMEINYAFMPMEDLGMTHHIGISMRFGSTADKAYREGVRLLNQNKPAEAILKFDEALRLDPRHPDAGMWLRRAYRRIQNAVQEAR